MSDSEDKDKQNSSSDNKTTGELESPVDRLDPVDEAVAKKADKLEEPQVDSEGVQEKREEAQEKDEEAQETNEKELVEETKAPEGSAQTPGKEQEPAKKSEAMTEEQIASGAAVAPVVVKARSGVAWLALLLALIACGGTGYLLWQYLTTGQAQIASLQESQLKFESMNTSLGVQESGLEKLNQQVASISGEIGQSESDSRKRIGELREELALAQQLLDSHARRLLSLTATTTDDWRIAEVDYLIRLANQRLVISRDSVTASELLAEADKILLELGDPRLFDLRRAIAEDSAALDVVGDVDTDGVFLKLAALANQVDQLPIISAPDFKRIESDEQTEEKVVDEGVAQPWYASTLAVFADGWAEVKSWLVINKQNTDIKPLLPPDQQYYLRANLKLLLNQAQLALLESRTQPFQQSLATASQWIEIHFPMDQAPNQRFVTTLTELSAMEIAPEYPDLSESLLTTKAFIRNQQVQAVEAGSNQEGEQ